MSPPAAKASEPAAEPTTAEARAVSPQVPPICPKCHSDKIVPAVQLAVVTEAGALLTAPGQGHAVRAWVCGSCGKAELYADHPEALYDTYQT